MKVLKDISYGIHKEQILDIYLPETDSFSTFIYFHGGGLEGGDKTEGQVLAEFLANKGIAVVSADYRMYPQAKYPEFIQDAAEVVAWVYQNIGNYGNCEKTFVGGSSAGGYISMMLCFDKQYLAAHGIDALKIDGYIHDAGQPTCHFNVLRERGIDSRRVIVDESAPLYHIGAENQYPPMLFIVSDNDIEGRYEQTMLVRASLKQFGHQIALKVMNGNHCAYISALDENGESVLGRMIYDHMMSL